MLGTKSCLAIAEIVSSNFGYKHLDKMVSQPTSTIIQILITQLAEVTSSFPTYQWKGHHGCLALVLDEAEMCLLTGDNNLAYRPIPKMDAINLLIVDDTKGRDIFKFQ